MEDVVPMDRLKDNGVLEEVPKERLSTMDKKPGTYDSVIWYWTAKVGIPLAEHISGQCHEQGGQFSNSRDKAPKNMNQKWNHPDYRFTWRILPGGL